LILRPQVHAAVDSALLLLKRLERRWLVTQ
jgi:hypothetical protein